MSASLPPEYTFHKGRVFVSLITLALAPRDSTWHIICTQHLFSEVNWIDSLPYEIMNRLCLYCWTPTPAFSQATLEAPTSIPTFSYFGLKLLAEGEKQEKWERDPVLHGATHPVAQPGVGILGRKWTNGEEPDPTFCLFIPNSY